MRDNRADEPIRLGGCLWSEDECTRGLDGHETIGDAWRRLFGAGFFTADALRREDHGDTYYYRMPNGRVAVLCYDGWYIHEEAE